MCCVYVFMYVFIPFTSVSVVYWEQFQSCKRSFSGSGGFRRINEVEFLAMLMGCGKLEIGIFPSHSRRQLGLHNKIG